MYPAICSYDEQSLNNMSEESKKNCCEEIVAVCSKSGHGWAGQKNMAASDPSEVTQETPLDPISSEAAEDAPNKRYN